MSNLRYSSKANRAATLKVKNSLHYPSAFAIILSALLTTKEQAKAESTYSASCRTLGDTITLTSTGRIVLEQRLVKFKPTEAYKQQIGQRGVCIIKKDPPGYKWIRCKRSNGFYKGGYEAGYVGIRPASFIPDQVQHMSPGSIVGACKVKL